MSRRRSTFRPCDPTPRQQGRMIRAGVVLAALVALLPPWILSL